jgi:N6-adenosine-specific RNA methylase IME4
MTTHPTSPGTAQRGQTLLGVSDGQTNAAPGEVGRFQVIYADPPWKFNDIPQKNGGACCHYPLMSDDELLAMAPFVRGLADDDCAFPMWASGARMDFALELMYAWGFRFVTTLFCWCKLYSTCGRPVFGMGRYTASTAEFVLLGAKGNVAPDEHRISQWVETPVVAACRTVHSEKPAEFRRRIECLWPDARRIELFCRHAPAGWTAWGNQVGLLDGGPKVIEPWIEEGQGRLFAREG